MDLSADVTHRLSSFSSIALRNTAQLRRLEHDAAQTLPPGTLMRRAGLAVARLVQARFAHARRIAVFVGPGNNGGDGLAAALHLQRAGRDVLVLACGNTALQSWAARLPPDAAGVWQDVQARQIPCRLLSAADDLPAADLYIDALLGIGLSGPVRDPLVATVRALQTPDCPPILSVDLPSGLDADRGTSGPECVRATVTLSLLGVKPGLCTGPQAWRCGEVWHDDLGVQPPASLVPAARWLGADVVRAALPHLPQAAHKGRRGDVRVIGGAAGMIGAALLAARTAAHLGAGRVHVGLLAPLTAQVDAQAPELMLRPPDSLLGGSVAAGCLLFGPGAGTAAAARDALQRALADPLPLVLDADGLNLLTTGSDNEELQAAVRQRTALTVLTPHPLEAARLLGTTVAAVQADRLRAACDLSTRFSAWVVLKGAGSVIASPQQELWVNSSGNGLLATAGSGDALAGAIAALLAARPHPHSVHAAVWLHGAAADAFLARRGPAGFCASALPEWMARAWNALCHGQFAAPFDGNA